MARFFFDDSGQDLIEYGLLTALIGVAAYLVIPAIRTGMEAAFPQWGNNVNAIWVPDNPL